MLKWLLERISWRLLCAIGRTLPSSRAASAGGSSGAGAALVLAPHQDDETLGCGAAIQAMHERGWRVWVAFATDGRRSHQSPRIGPEELARRREAESIEACRRLGVPAARVVHLRFQEGRLEAEQARLVERLARLVEDVDPDEVYVTSSLDPHRDHRTLNHALQEVALRGGVRGRVLEYPVWYWMGPWYRSWLARGLASCWWPWRARSGPHALERAARPLLVRAGPYLARKRHALAAHGTQVRRQYGDPSWPILADVGGGRFLANLFREHEVFFELRCPRSAGALASPADVRATETAPPGVPNARPHGRPAQPAARGGPHPTKAA